MKLAVLTPLPPAKSGIAHYSSLILPELARRHDVTAVVDQQEISVDICPVMQFAEFERIHGSFDAVVCQLGNNLNHEFVWNWARRNPSVIVLHEIVLHHLIVETTLARGSGAQLAEELARQYGDVGVAIAEARMAGLHGEIANFLLPASGMLAEASSQVIVHNRWAAARLGEEGVTTPISVVRHPFDEPPAFSDDEIAEVRRAAGWGGANRVIGSFGFVTEAKRPAIVMEAFAEAVRRNSRLRLVFVGEPAPNIDLDDMARSTGLPRDSWKATGYVTNEEFDLWMNAVDRVASLRYPTAGESSGPIVRAFAVGRPVAVNDYAQFAEFPDDLVVKIPFESEVDTLARFFLDDGLDGPAIARAQRAWLEENASVVHAVDGYDMALQSVPSRANVPVSTDGLPLFPRLEASLGEIRRDADRTAISIRLTNRGPITLKCAVWGGPNYLLQSRCVATDGSFTASTRALGGDLRSGESTTIELYGPGAVARIELRHSMSGVPEADRPPFAVLEPGG